MHSLLARARQPSHAPATTTNLPERAVMTPRRKRPKAIDGDMVGSKMREKRRRGNIGYDCYHKIHEALPVRTQRLHQGGSRSLS